MSAVAFISFYIFFPSSVVYQLSIVLCSFPSIFTCFHTLFGCHPAFSILSPLSFLHSINHLFLNVVLLYPFISFLSFFSILLIILFSLPACSSTSVPFRLCPNFHFPLSNSTWRVEHSSKKGKQNYGRGELSPFCIFHGGLLSLFHFPPSLFRTLTWCRVRL